MQGPRHLVGVREEAWPEPQTRAAGPRRPGRAGFHRRGAERAVADGHHRAPHGRGQALPLRGQGRLFRQDRRLLDGLADEVFAGRRRAGERGAVTPPGRDIVHSDRGSQFRSRRFVESSGTTGSPARWDGSVRARTTPRWNRSSRCCRRTSWTVNGGPPGRNSGWPSRPGSKGPTTAGDGKDGWANSRPSNMKQSTGPRSQRPKTPSQQKPGQSLFFLRVGMSRPRH